eukprot:334761_1
MAQQSNVSIHRDHTIDTNDELDPPDDVTYEYPETPLLLFDGFNTDVIHTNYLEALNNDRNRHWNIAQQKLHQQHSHQSITENIHTFIHNTLDWIGSYFYTKDDLSDDELMNISYLDQLFHELDKDNNGKIDRHELFEGFREGGAGDRFTQREILSVIEFIDLDGDGEIDRQEFIHMFHPMAVRSMEDLIEKSYLYIMFRRIDDDASGSITFDELKSFFAQNNMKFNDSEIIRLMSEVDYDGDGEMDFREFYHIFGNVKSFDDLVVQSRLKLIFNSVDTDGSGELDFEEIKELFEKERIQISDKELRAMMNSIDINGDGVIDFDEFTEAFSMITDLQDLVNMWQNLNSIDIGSDLAVGSGLSQLSFLPILAGGLGGIMSRTATAPLERVKILAQTGTCTGNLRSMFTTVIERQGFWFGLWKGNFYGCLRTFPFAGCVTFTYSMFLKHVIPKQYRQRIDNPKDPVTHLWRFSAGLTAGCIATTITYPLDLMKANETCDMTQTRGQPKQPKESKLVTRVRNHLRIKNMKLNFVKEMHENQIFTFRDAFRGLLPTIFAVPFFIGIQNMSYDFLRIYCTSEDYLDMTPSIELFAACGCVAGMTAQSIVYPIDVIRRRVQTDTLWPCTRKCPSGNMKMCDQGTKLNLVNEHRSMMRGVANIVRCQGLRPLFAGMTPTYLKVMPSVAISVTTRDILLGRLNKD